MLVVGLPRTGKVPCGIGVPVLEHVNGASAGVPFDLRTAEPPHRVYHDKDECRMGRDIPERERQAGTGAIGSAWSVKG